MVHSRQSDADPLTWALQLHGELNNTTEPRITFDGARYSLREWGFVGGWAEVSYEIILQCNSSFEIYILRSNLATLK